jgi:hypothetical protein
VSPYFNGNVFGVKGMSVIFYDLSKEECHFHRQNVYKSGPNDWCDNGEWLYEDKEHEVRGGSTNLYPQLMEGLDTETK